MQEIKIKIKGMHCTSCSMLIENEIEDLGNINQVKCDYARAECMIKGENLNLDIIKNIINKLGYQLEG